MTSLSKLRKADLVVKTNVLVFEYQALLDHYEKIVNDPATPASNILWIARLLDRNFGRLAPLGWKRIEGEKEP